MAFLGMRSDADWVANQMPEHWREAVLYLYPNGDAPLTAMLSRMPEEKVTAPIFHWWTYSLPTQSITLENSGVYINSDLSTAYVYATHQATIGIASGTVYLDTSVADSKNFREGHQVLLRDADRYDVDVVGKVTNVDSVAGIVAVKLLEADDNSASASTYNLATVDTVLIGGTINAEGAERPESVQYDMTEFYNYTQIFRNSVDLTRTAMLTKLRTGDPLKEARRQCLELHSIEMERAFLFGIRSSNTGPNGKPERTTEGLIPAIKRNVSGNVFDYVSNSTYSGDTWLQSGETWFDATLEQLFRYGRDEKLAYCGSGALLGIMQLAKSGAHIHLRPMDTAYGIKVVEWVTPFGVVYLKRHPLFSYESTNRNSMLILEPQNLKYNYITDTTFLDDKSWQEGGNSGVDGVQEEYKTECGLEYHFPESMGWLNGVGLPNTA